ncbi:hypothetical protein D3C73_1223150 [compost metagenome]
MHILHAGHHLADGAEEGDLAGDGHRQLLLIAGRQDGLPDRFVPVGDSRDFDDGLFRMRPVIAAQLAKRAL